MVKRLLSVLLAAALILSMSGCWNYRSLDQVNIVVGIAADFDKEKKMFDINYEVADLAAAGKDKSIKGKIIDSQGKTMFDVARNAKREEADKLFFGSLHVMVIGQDLAREIDLLEMVEWFLHDGECRETMCVAISQDETAKSILEAPEEATSIVSSTLYDIITEDKDVTGTAKDVRLYQLYNILHSPRKSVVLPAIRNVQNGKNKTPEVNGVAVIANGRLAGFIPPEQSKYILFVEGELSSGILTLSISDSPMDDISLEIFANKAKKSYRYEQGKITVHIETETSVAIAENQSHMDVMDRSVIKRIEDDAAQMIKANIQNLIATLQHEFDADIFGFGEMIYKKDLKLWEQLSPSWDEIYPTLEVEVSSKVKVVNSAFIK